MNKAIVWLFRIASVVCILYPMYYLTEKFSRVDVIDAREAYEKTSIDIPVLIFLSAFSLVAIIAFSTWIFSVYLSKAKENPFSSLVVIPFGLVLFAMTWFAKEWVNKIHIMIEVNADQFMADLTVYAQSLGVTMIWIGIGVACGVVSLLYQPLANLFDRD